MQLEEFSEFGNSVDVMSEFVKTTGIIFLLVSIPGCRACEEMKAALMEYKSPVPCGAFFWIPPQSAEGAADVATNLQILEFPGLLMIADGKVFKRWSGFFDSQSTHERSTLLSDVLNRALKSLAAASSTEKSQ